MKTNCALCGNELDRQPSRAKRLCFCNQTHHLLYAYEYGLRDPLAITNGAHQTLREKGHYKRDNSYLRDDRAPSKQPAARAKISAAKLARNWMRGRTGKLHHNWLGGKIWWRGKEWDQLKLRIRTRDGFMCAECDMTEWQHKEQWGHPLHVHHVIAYRISHDNSPLNLITLCDSCHGKKKQEENALIEQVRELLTA